MSAFTVPIEHIRAMINAGLDIEYGPLRWRAAQLTEEQKQRAYERGEPWGREATDVYRETFRELTHANAEAVGVMLMAENRRSVDYRYDEQEIEEFYTHGPSSRREPIEILKAISCYEYQSCETPDWGQSESASFCQALRVQMIHLLPGFAEAEGWPIMTA
ncbi:MAG: hypothetical protein ACK5LO_09825 [Leucobacter sp.]